MNVLKRLTGMLKPYTWQLTLAFVSLTLTVVSDLMIPLQIQRIIDDGIAVNNNAVIINSTLIMIGLALFSLVMAFMNIFYSVKIAEGFAADLRDRGYRQTQSFSFANLDKLQTGELLVRLTSDIDLIKNALTMVVRMAFRAPLMLVGALVILVMTSPTLSLLLLVLIPATVALIVGFSLRSAPLFKKVQAQLDRVNTVLQENIAGMQVVKAFVRSEREKERFAVANAGYTARGIEVNTLLALLLPAMIVLLNLGTTAIIYFGGTLSIRGLGLTTGEIVAFVNYMGMIMFPIMMLGMILPQIYASVASAERLFEIIDNDATVTDKADTVRLEHLRGRVEFQNVSFSYGADDSREAVLRDISFTAEPGETVAILGATGSGKTSLINLIARFYDVTEGRILIDGLDVRDMAQETLHRNTGFALQEAVLFSGTVRENIAFGRKDATEAEIVAAAQAAQAHDFIMEKPEGYEARVEQRGKNFSGGQKQRIAIARALCVEPAILILDDSTSAVDIDTEAKIQEALATVATRSTTFVVAQRISTVLSADKIIVLEHGQIAAVGNHQALIGSSPIYQEIYRSQLGALPEPVGVGGYRGGQHV